MAQAKRATKKTKAKTTAAKRARLPAGPSARVRKVEAEAEAESQGPPPVHEREWWRSADDRARLIQGDSLEILTELPEHSFDVIFADPPYFLSNGGTTCQAGKRVNVNKGKWDASMGAQDNHAFNKRWLAACQRLLTKNGTIWVSGTSHVIYSVGFALQELGFKMLNDVVWEKPNPPPNLSCRYFTHSTELVLWAARDRKSKHHFEYAEMKQRNGNKQMKNVWRFTAPGKSEKTHGKHPTQKPLKLLDRLLTASCPEGARVLDPFNGSGTTGVAATRLGHSYTGIERDPEYLELTKARLIAEVPEWGVDAPIAAPIAAVG
ncbi:Modification methylase DpnIIB [Enhygromyxa salina]|uniref:Methyltransferase n=1 Tax=Enhygromyxa salina TaxID=215803 RepID=A0A2S9XF39_9BACT|nr:site-specific DNA-methyltransferase [Enhygromyxa salina]PRP91291.1 Modification methylase DpnIIB [Enhygromyxa salina]